MKKLFLLVVTLCCLSWNIHAKATLTDVIRKNYVELIMASDVKDAGADYVNSLRALPDDKEIGDRCVIELYQRIPVNTARVKDLLNQMQKDGTWTDINYQDKTRSGWKVKTHVERIFDLSRYYRLMKVQDNRKEARMALHGINKATTWWVENNPICPNWFHNQIGVPRTFGYALVLVWDELGSKLQKKVLDVVYEQHVRISKTGQNRVWLAGNILIKALLKNDEVLLREARDVIASEVKLGQGEGIQKDWSFHQHGPQQQFGNYGMAYLSTLSFYDNLFNETELQFDENQRKILISLLNEGYGWIHWNNRLDVNCFNRQYFKNVENGKFLIAQLSARAMTGENLVSQKGHKHFDYSDMTIHRMDNWMASVKMASDRVKGFEHLNGDNQQGYYTGDGATFVYVDGSEYHDIYPLWDWRKIPGVTCYQSVKNVPGETAKVDRRNHGQFVGGLTVDNKGVTVMEVNRNGLHAQKMWAFDEDMMICLGSDIHTDSLPVATTLEQCMADSNWKECGTQRYLMRQKGFIVPGNQAIVSQVANRKGDWNKVMKLYQPCEVSGKVATLYIDHGMAKGADYSYIVLPGATAQSLEAFDMNRIKILANNKDIQLVEVDGNTFYAVIYKDNQKLEKAGEGQWEFSTAGLFLGKKVNGAWKVTYKDPTMKGKEGKFTTR